jgi:lipoyl(octanoyl) transferase
LISRAGSGWWPTIDRSGAGYYVQEYVYRIEEAVIRTLTFRRDRVPVPGTGNLCRLDDPFSHAVLKRPAMTDSTRTEPSVCAQTGGLSSGLGKIAARWASGEPPLHLPRRGAECAMDQHFAHPRLRLCRAADPRIFGSLNAVTSDEVAAVLEKLGSQLAPSLDLKRVPA